MDPSLGTLPAQMLTAKCPPAGQKLTFVSLDPSKSGVKVQLPSQHHISQPGISMTAPGVTLTVSPSSQLGVKSRSLPSSKGARLDAHDPKTKTLIVTSPCIKWIKSGQNFKVINLPLSLMPSLNICRLPNTKSIVISRPSNVNQIIIHKEAPLQRRGEGLHRSPALSVPWRAQMTPIVFSASPSPVVLSISQAAGGGGAGGPPGIQEPVANLSINSGYSRGVYENFRKWQQYKGLVRKHFPLTPDTEAVACFFIPVLRSLSQFKPQLCTEEGISLAIQEWSKLNNFDRMIYYEMAEKFMEFEIEEQAQRLQCEQVPVQPGLTPGVQLAPGTSGKPNKQIVEDPVGKKGTNKGSGQRSHKQAKAPPQAGAGPGIRQQPIPLEAITQYIEIMEALSQNQQAEGEGAAEALEEGPSEEPELIKYIEKLCSKNSFISKAEAIIHPEFLSNLLSPHGHMDFPRLMKQLEMDEHLSAAELEGRRDATQAANHRHEEPAEPCPPLPDHPPQILNPVPPSSEVTHPLQGLLLPPLGRECLYSSRLQRLALQAAPALPEGPAPSLSPPAPRPQQARHVLLRELRGEAAPGPGSPPPLLQAARLPAGVEPQAPGPVARGGQLGLRLPDPPGALASPSAEVEGAPEPEAVEQAQPEAPAHPQASPPPPAHPQASPTPAGSQLPGAAPPAQPPLLDAGDAHPPPWAALEGQDAEGAGSSSQEKPAEGEACSLGPAPLPGYRSPWRPLRSSSKPLATVPRVRSRHQKRSNSSPAVRRSKRVKRN
ncbi:uncharacterized protein [Scyliorhinus torazame]|uniref:uncharacterized protein n=1 Tax=Scyliorhinus torazame TaxID=75743 RepID=UPI003B5CF2F5